MIQTIAAMIRPASLVLFGVLASALPGPAAAPPAAAFTGGLERCVPADAMLFVGVDDVSALRRDFVATSLGQWIGSEEFAGVREFVGAELQSLMTTVGEDEASLFDVGAMIHGGAAFALLDVGSPRADGGLPVAFAVLLDAGEDELRVLDAVDRAIRADVESGAMVRSSARVGEAEVIRIVPADRGAGASGSDPAGLDPTALDPTELRYAVRRGVFVAVISSRSLQGGDRIATLLAGVDGDLPQSLRDAETFRASGAAAPDMHIRGFLDIGGLLARALVGLVEREKLSEGDVRRIAGLGLYDVTQASFAMGFQSAGTEARLDLRWSGQGAIPSLLRALFRPTELRTPQLMPKDARSAVAVGVDLVGGLAAFLEIMRDLMPEEGALMAELVDTTLHQGDLDLERDVLANIDGEIGAFLVEIEDDLEALPGGDLDPLGLAVLIPLRDGAALEQVVEQLLEETGMRAVRTRIPIAGIPVSKLPVGFVRNLYVAIEADLLILTTAREAMEKTLGLQLDLQQAPESGGDSLARTDGYRDAVLAFADGRPSLVWAGDAAAGARDLLAGLETAIRSSPVAAPGGELPFQFPSLGSVEEFFDGVSVRVLVVDDRGIRLRSRSGR